MRLHGSASMMNPFSISTASLIIVCSVSVEGLFLSNLKSSTANSW